jgi:hypothetical protein
MKRLTARLGAATASAFAATLLSAPRIERVAVPRMTDTGASAPAASGMRRVASPEASGFRLTVAGSAIDVTFSPGPLVSCLIS